MKKITALLLAAILLLAFSACGKTTNPANTETPAANSETPTANSETPPANSEDTAASDVKIGIILVGDETLVMTAHI